MDDDRDTTDGTRAKPAASLRDELREAAAELTRDLRDAATEIRDDLRSSAAEVREELATATRSIEILWGVDDPPSRGPKATLTRERIVTAAIELADAEGLEAASMRAVAKRLGVGVMSLYRHVPGKPELLALMVDRINGEAPRVDEAVGTWRERLEAVAWGEWAMSLRHPWILGVTGQISRPTSGPNTMAAYESALTAAADTGLPAREVVGAVMGIYFLTDGAARAAVEHATVERCTGVSNEQWWEARAAVLNEVVDAADYPTFVALAEAGAFGEVRPGEGYEDPIDVEEQFASALAALLDGIEARIARLGGDGRSG